MEEDFYRGRLARKFGLEVRVPDTAAREMIHRVIYQELCRGIISESSRESLAEVVSNLADQGAEGVVLGCTEIGLLLRPEDVSVPLFDTALLHAEEAARWALGEAPATRCVCE
jgi:aspartate racemase